MVCRSSNSCYSLCKHTADIVKRGSGPSVSRLLRLSRVPPRSGGYCTRTSPVDVTHNITAVPAMQDRQITLLTRSTRFQRSAEQGSVQGGAAEANNNVVVSSDTR